MRLQMMLMRKEMEDGLRSRGDFIAKRIVLGHCDWTSAIADGGGDWGVH
jgi:hypothetical protein